MESVLVAVRGADGISLVPAGGLRLLPLHAAWTPDPGRPIRRRYALDEVLLTYAMTSGAPTVARARAQAVRPGSLLVVDEPTPVAGSPLPYSAVECAAAFAAWDAVRAQLRAAVLAHLSCRGPADVVDPGLSWLEVADHGEVTVADLLS
ncbi:CHAT domain-containing protein [Streptomyces sp. NPDC059193]|uniref:CHAT domain-containing protein n=1 Tax=Streptomyces sp. NPDC059193 TaxID=3346763 RepID=UPI0036CE3B97